MGTKKHEGDAYADLPFLCLTINIHSFTLSLSLIAA